ncbi:aspartate aminotransferase family protein [Stappia sp. ES.058]|uniref:aspartate aminotransferase family protein n=1 Tax=Stappia sp. ES.058 TaxID=1881061 RepID=UPI00087CFFF0|nr:aspartate aminotransferase family protein [Stappia sp. ES.058]SDU45617.1 Adenosylmethionine-8-amino-7-oxononanoate aminotransferase [Stappia sp. ES.058]
MTHVFHRSPKSALPVAVHGSGTYVTDDSGKRYIDACGGAAVSCIGHGDRRVQEAVQRQMAEISYAHTSFFTSPAAEALADHLCEATPVPLDKVYFVGSGSEAVEAAIKMARQYHLERGEPSRKLVISRHQSYHGNTLGALSVGGNPPRRKPYGPFLLDEPKIEPCFSYRYGRDGESAEDYALRAANLLEEKILELGPETVVAFLAETVVGATAGAVTAEAGYFRRIREICDRHGVLLILDEVMCGAGRTGSFLACEQEDVAPDILTLAKGLGGGYQPIAAVMCTDHVYRTIVEGSGSFVHGHTYSAHPIACAAALAVQQVIREDDLLENVVERGAQLRERLEARFGNHPHVGDVRGRGLLQAIELVEHRDDKTPFSPDRRIGARIKRDAMALGLMVYPGAGTIDGVSGDHVLLAPPYTVDANTIDLIVERLGLAVDAALAE